MSCDEGERAWKAGPWATDGHSPSPYGDAFCDPRSMCLPDLCAVRPWWELTISDSGSLVAQPRWKTHYSVILGHFLQDLDGNLRL